MFDFFVNWMTAKVDYFKVIGTSFFPRASEPVIWDINDRSFVHFYS